MTAKPPLPTYEQACVRAWAMDYAIKANAGNPHLYTHEIIDEAREIEAYLMGRDRKPNLNVIVEYKNGKRK
jgi:hypothetical protein